MLIRTAEELLKLNLKDAYFAIERNFYDNRDKIVAQKSKEIQQNNKSARQFTQQKIFTDTNMEQVILFLF